MLTTKIFGFSFFETLIIASALTPELTTGLSILIAAIFVGLLNLYTARTARMVALKEMVKVIAPIEMKVEKIEAHVNSEKTKDSGVIASQLIQLEMKDKIIADLRDAAAILAQAKVMAEMVAAVSGAAVAGATTPVSAKPGVPTTTPDVRIAEATERGANAQERAATAQVQASEQQQSAADTQERAANKKHDQ